MRPITVYEANDGSRWDSPERAEERDVLIAECAEASAFLRPTPKDDGCRFANGHGFVQQPTGSRERLLEFLRSKGAHRDSDGPIGKLLYRAHSIDPYDREWGQVYVALNPHRGEQVAL